MTTTDRAAKIVSDTLGVLTFSAENTAYRLAKAGLLTPEPQIIRTREELANLDPDTVLITGGPSDPWAVDEINTASDTDWFLPAVVVATGDQVRAARQALEEE